MPSDHQDNGPLWFEIEDDFRRARDVLSAAEFRDTPIAARLGIDNARSLSGRDISLLLRATAGGEPLDTLIRLFLIGVSTDTADAARAVAPMALETWIEAGLLRVEKAGASVVATVQWLPLGEHLLAFDRPDAMAEGLAEDYVMGIGSSTLTLANATVRTDCQHALDLGTGCGYLAFLAAKHARRVWAVDRNPRAVGIAAFNARLNGLDNVKCLQGDLFAPVEGQTFDLVVSNPPFVISPETRYIYRDSGMKGDEITQTIVRRVGRYLSDGGFCQILCNWAHLADQDWRDRLRGWFAETDCDAWVMPTDTLDAEDYAAKWIRHTERVDPQEFGRRLDEWMAYYRQQGIEAVSGGLINMRRRAGGDHWFSAEEGPPRMLGQAGEAIRQCFCAEDFLRATSDEELLASHALRVSPDLRLEQSLEPDAPGWRIAEAQLRLVRGLAYSGNIDPYMARLVAGCQGETRLADLVTDLATSLEKPPSEVTPAALGLIRQLIRRGFLLPV